MPAGICHRRPRRGFTLIELLVVIGIIVILLGILLPVVATIRKKGQQTDTNAEMTRIATAIHNYYQDHRAFPGPLPDSAIYGFNAGTSQTSGLTNASIVTSSENLVLGLLGGIAAPTSATQTTFTYTVALVNKGPQSLNYGNPQLYPNYVDASTTELGNDGAGNFASWTKTQGATYASPALTIPEFLDHYSNPHPIIYLRARVGGTTVCDAANTSQYYSQEMAPYWKGSSSAPFPTKPDPNNNNAVLYSNATSFFQNPSMVGVARSQDTFILISAGYDGIYGTTDDIVLGN